MSVTKTTKIGGFTVEIDQYTDGGEDRCDCVISKGDYSGSLALLYNTGHIDYSASGSPTNGYEMDVPEATIDKIVVWADQNGYND